MLTCRVERECYPKVGKDTIKEIKLQKKKKMVKSMRQ